MNAVGVLFVATGCYKETGLRHCVLLCAAMATNTVWGEGGNEFRRDFAGYWEGDKAEKRVLLGIPTVDIASSDISPPSGGLVLGASVSLLNTADTGRWF